ncbi:MAG: cysteine peptidase family C39 domain-containing protein [Solirubrobacteraceae bacterium]
MARRKVPVMRQDSELECGATCLAMVLGYYGRDVTVAECHERCNVGRDGQRPRWTSPRPPAPTACR